MKRDWSGCERRRCLRPPSQISSAMRRSGSGVYPVFETASPPPAPHPTVPRGGPCYRPPPCIRASGPLPAETHASDTGEVIIMRQAAVNRRRVAWFHRPALGAMDGQRIPRNAGEPREAASQGVGLRPGQGSSSHHFDANGPLRLAAIRLPARGARPPTCAPRRHGVTRDRHGAAWRASLQCCGRSPLCRAWCRRRHRDCR